MNPEVVINHSAPSSGQQRVGGDYSYLRFRLESGSPLLLDAGQVCLAKSMKFNLKVSYTWPHVQMSWNIRIQKKQKKD